MEPADYILSPEFTHDAEAAIDRARIETLAAGVTVFYRDVSSGMEIMERPDGRRFEVRYVPGAPAERNYEILRELAASAA